MLDFIVNGQRLISACDPGVVADTINYLELKFEFSADWADVIPWAEILAPDGTKITPIIENGVVSAEKGINLTAGVWTLSVVGDKYEGGEVVKRITTNTVTITVEASGISDGGPFHIDIDAGSEIIARAASFAAVAEDAIAEAERKIAEAQGQIEEAKRIIHDAEGISDQAAKDAKTALDAAKSVPAAVTNATNATIQANRAATNANTEATRASQLYGEVKAALDSGALNGRDGYTPVKGVDYFDGQPGPAGQPGYTPIKGVDYNDGEPGPEGPVGPAGKDWEPTPEDLEAIAENAAGKLQPSVSELKRDLAQLERTVDVKANKTEIPDISGKANVGDSYTKSQSDAKYLTQHQSLVGLATETYVNGKVAELVNSAPSTLDTLKELSDALGNDPNFATTVTRLIGEKQDKIADIDSIRAKANSALQQHQSLEGYATEAYVATEISKSIVQLPVGYIQCKGLVGDGTAWIDTGIIHDPTKLTVIIRWNQKEIGYVYGRIERTSNPFIRNYCGCGIAEVSDKSYLIIGSGASMLYDGNFAIQFSDSNEMFAVFRKSNNFIGLSKQRICETPRGDVYNAPQKTATLFTAKDISSIGLPETILKAEVFSYTVYDENFNLMMNLIPCLDTNMTPCFYDTVSKRSLYNAADSGSFLPDL